MSHKPSPLAWSSPRGALVVLLAAFAFGACPQLCGPYPDGYVECTDDDECDADAGLVCDGRTATCMYPDDIAARCIECAVNADCGYTQCECDGQTFFAEHTCDSAGDGGCATCVLTPCTCP